MGSKSLSATSTVEASKSVNLEEQKIKSLWTALQVADKQHEKRGLQFGQAMYEYREKHSAQGSRNDLTSSQVEGSGFSSLLQRLAIPETTAYRWIARYEESIGEREVPVAPEPPQQESLPEEPITESIPMTPMTLEERDNQQLRDFTHRLVSVTSALKTLIGNDSTQLAEYPNMVAAAKTLAKVIEEL